VAATDPAPSPTRLAVFRELTSVIQRHRSGVHGDRMARNLPRFEPGRDLVAVGPDADRAIYHEIASQSVVAVRFDEHRTYEGRQELLTPGLDGPDNWLDASAGGGTWEHPRNR